ncbi:BEN domain-containing protein 2, partial [Enhydra lutris kenyoni]|uniref:BEN domain-containing protein 2 n=1 Tax=Enhydra lutris kenyoni TaxID=391180 RepID=A0A2Y9JR31_ENHLU
VETERGKAPHLAPPLPYPQQSCSRGAFWGATAQSQKLLLGGEVSVLPFGASICCSCLVGTVAIQRVQPQRRRRSYSTQSGTPFLTMSEEEDYIIITVEDDSDGDDDIGVVIIEDSETELTENTHPTDGMLTIEPNFQASNDNYQQLSQMRYGVGGLPALRDQAVPQMNHLANLKRYSSNSVEMDLLPPQLKRGCSSFLRVGNMASNAFEGFRDENHQNRLTELQHHCKDLHELIESTNRQVNNLCGIISKMQQPWEKPLLPDCEDDSPPGPVGRKENHVLPNPAEISLQPAVLPEPVVRESPPFPKIVSTYSLQPSVTPGSPAPGLAVLSYVFSEGDEEVTGDLSSAQHPALPAALLSPGEPLMALSPEVATCSTGQGPIPVGPDPASLAFCIPSNFAPENLLFVEMPGEAEASLGNSMESVYYPSSRGDGSGQDTVSSVFILPNFVITETSLENNPEMTNYQTLSGNNSDHCSSVCLPPNFAVEKFILIEVPEKSETSQENSSKTIYYPALLGSINGPGTDSSSASLPPNFVEKVVLVETPENAETSLENSCQTVYYQTSSGNDSDPAPASSSFSIPPDFEVLVKAETSLENSTQMTDYQALVENDNGQETSAYYFIPSNVESGKEMNSETTSSPILMENDNKQDTGSESFFLAPGFALLPVEILLKAENRVGNVPEIMNYPVVLEKNNSQDSISPSLCGASGFGYLGDPKRNVRLLNTNLLTAQKKSHPRHAARYLVHVLFSKEILVRSWVGINSQGRQPLDPNKVAAIREHLATNFPNHDLRECGKDWKTCVADINSLIYCLCAESITAPQRTGDSNKGPPSLHIPVPAHLNDKGGTDGHESSSQLCERTIAFETRENGNSWWDNSVYPQGVQELPTENSVICYEALEYLGNPGRNIQLPHSVLTIAKGKSRPELAARYLIRNLFTEDVLIKSNVYGNLGYGMYALNPNRIHALREFLQDIYPTCSLSETGYDWKLCVTAINSSIRSLRYDLKKSTSKP